VFKRVSEKKGAAGLEIEQFFCRADNFGLLIHDPVTGETAAVDTPDFAPIQAKLQEKGWRLTHIFTTHHHTDHVEGHIAFKSETGCQILGAASDEGRIPGMDVRLREGADFQLGRFWVRPLETPGHTSGHLTYYLPEPGVVFTGDTLFSLGCGRLFEGDAATMWRSLQKIAALPPETLIYCGHDYTVDNSGFALTIEPENEALQRRAGEALQLAEKGQATLPVSLANELAANPFLRAGSPAIQKRLGLTGSPLAEVFGEIRRRKDNFRN
jgi:hydroxyacylglutathione hydrolase